MFPRYTRDGLCMKAIRFHQNGAAEVLQYEDVEDPSPGQGEVLVELEAAGLNYIDTYHREGLYPVDLPCTPGMEGAGVVRELGSEVSDFAIGDRVAYAGTMGSYAQLACVDAARLVSLPEGLDIEKGAAALLQGMTAHYLAHGSYPLSPGDVAIVHAAAGGVGLLLVQMAKRAGARVIGTVSTEEKEQLARNAGADDIIRYTEVDYEETVNELTDGEGVNVIYDSVGKTTFLKGLNLLRPRGYMVLFGQSSGPVEPFDPQLLSAGGSLFVTRPTMNHYVQNRDELVNRAIDVLNWIQSGELDLRIGARYPLSEAAEAHRSLQGRLTTGKVVHLTSD